MLACKRLFGKHTYDNLAKAVQGVHMTFGITDKVVTTDNGSNFVKAFKQVFSFYYTQLSKRVTHIEKTYVFRRCRKKL